MIDCPHNNPVDINNLNCSGLKNADAVSIIGTPQLLTDFSKEMAYINSINTTEGLAVANNGVERRSQDEARAAVKKITEFAKSAVKKAINTGTPRDAYQVANNTYLATEIATQFLRR